jgi:hypothetical protein
MGKPLAGASRGRAPLAAFAVACFCRRGVAGRVDRPAEEGGAGRAATEDRETIPPSKDGGSRYVTCNTVMKLCCREVPCLRA